MGKNDNVVRRQDQLALMENNDFEVSVMMLTGFW